ncbi:MAG TPA: hypothetical protein VK831_07425 [Candidatus Deferrimicrobiaceae bacterium]|nr:hypothetical protein [Candidatus Deferrimicrobiaceae bacterium]
MAKRVRYSGKSGRRNRPSRAASERPAHAAPPPAPAPPEPVGGDDAPVDMPLRSSGHLTEDEIQRASELEAEQAALERAAIAEAIRRRTRGRAHDAAAGVDVNAPLSVRAAHEYAYVARDVRRIGLTAGLTIAILAIVYVLVNVLGVVSV